MWIDTHCHLDAPEFDADRAELCRAALQRHVSAMILPAVSTQNLGTVQGLAHQMATTPNSAPRAFYALGIHPLYELGPQAAATSVLLETLEAAIQAALSDPLFVGVGEIGLDFFVPDLDRTKMTALFEGQLRLAKRYDLPVLLHVRRAQDAVLAALRRLGIERGIAHAFNGSDQQAAHYVRQGLKLGLGGVATFERSRQIRRLASALPIDALVLETDAPDLPPAWSAPGRNEPAEIAGIATHLAELRQMPLAEFAHHMKINTLQALPRLSL